MSNKAFTLKDFYPIIKLELLLWFFFAVYHLGPFISLPKVHWTFGLISGTCFFVLLNFGGFYLHRALVNEVDSLSGILLISLLLPVSWIIKEIIRLTAAFTILESLYYFTNPLSIATICATIFCIGIAELMFGKKNAQTESRRRLAWFYVLFGLGMIIFLFTWKKGEEAFYIHLSGFRWIFGPGADL